MNTSMDCIVIGAYIRSSWFVVAHCAIWPCQLNFLRFYETIGRNLYKNVTTFKYYLILIRIFFWVALL